MTDGSLAHKTLFCTTFIETHRRFEPAALPWPKIDATSIDRLRSIPFWSVALAAERNAGRMVTAYAKTIEDPLIREALAMQGVEEDRHARLLDVMLRTYGVSVAEKPLPPLVATERAFIDFGYEECIDSFFGFGIFGLARQIQLFVPELTDIFELVLLEEARHVTFFVNWVAFERIRRGRGAPAFQALSTALGYARAIKRIVTTFAPAAGDGQKTQGVGFGAEGAFALFSDVTWRDFLRSCVDENERYMAAMPADLMTPTVLPKLAGLALALPALPRLPWKPSSVAPRRDEADPVAAGEAAHLLGGQRQYVGALGERAQVGDPLAVDQVHVG
jgi:hypothetical protein